MVDAKEYMGAVTKVDVGDWWRTDYRLRVAGRDRTKLLEALGWQMERAREALAYLAQACRSPSGAPCALWARNGPGSAPILWSLGA